MKRVMQLSLIAGLLLAPFALIAGGTSDTSGEGFHCYLFFSEDPDSTEHTRRTRFAQAMVNDDSNRVAKQKVREFLDKYEGDERMYLITSVGNVRWRPGSPHEGICQALVCEEPVCDDPRAIIPEEFQVGDWEGVQCCPAGYIFNPEYDPSGDYDDDICIHEDSGMPM